MSSHLKWSTNPRVRLQGESLQRRGELGSPIIEDAQIRAPDVSGVIEKNEFNVQLLDESENLNLSELLGSKRDISPFGKTPPRKEYEQRGTLNNQRTLQGKKTEITNKVEVFETGNQFYPRSQSIHKRTGEARTLKSVKSTKEIKIDDRLKEYSKNLKLAIKSGEIEVEMAKKALRELLTELDGIVLEKGTLPLKGKKQQELEVVTFNLKLIRANLEEEEKEVGIIQERLRAVESERAAVIGRQAELAEERTALLQKINELEKDIEKRSKEERLGQSELRELTRKYESVELRAEARQLQAPKTGLSRKTLKVRPDFETLLTASSKPSINTSKNDVSGHNYNSLSEQHKPVEQQDNGKSCRTHSANLKAENLTQSKHDLEKKFQSVTQEAITTELAIDQANIELATLRQQIDTESESLARLRRELEIVTYTSKEAQEKLANMKNEQKALISDFITSEQTTAETKAIAVALQMLFDKLNDICGPSADSTVITRQGVRNSIIEVEKQLAKHVVYQKYSQFDAEVLQTLKQRLEDQHLGPIEKVLEFDDFVQNSTKSNAFINLFHEKCENFARIKELLLGPEADVRRQIDELKSARVTVESAISKRPSLNIEVAVPRETADELEIENQELERELQSFDGKASLTHSQTLPSKTRHRHAESATAYGQFAQLFDLKVSVPEVSRISQIDSPKYPLKSNPSRNRPSRFLYPNLDTSADLRRGSTSKVNDSLKISQTPLEIGNEWDRVFKNLNKVVNFVIKCSSNFANLLSIVVAKIPKDTAGSKSLRAMLTRYDYQLSK